MTLATSPLLGALAIVALLLVASPAHADSGRLGFDVSAATEATWNRAMPPLSFNDTQPWSNAGTSVRAPSVASLAFLGVGADFSLVYHRHWLVPLFGGSVAAAIGPSAAMLASANGSIVESRPWTTYRLEGRLPGIGYRFQARRWLFSGTVRLGLVGYGRTDAVAAGANETRVQATSSVEPEVRAEVRVCRRLDPEARACLSIAPSIYDGTLFSGGTAALLLEFGR